MRSLMTRARAARVLALRASRSPVGRMVRVEVVEPRFGLACRVDQFPYLFPRDQLGPAVRVTEGDSRGEVHLGSDAVPLAHTLVAL